MNGCSQDIYMVGPKHTIFKMEIMLISDIFNGTQFRHFSGDLRRGLGQGPRGWVRHRLRLGMGIYGGDSRRLSRVVTGGHDHSGLQDFFPFLSAYWSWISLQLGTIVSKYKSIWRYHLCKIGNQWRSVYSEASSIPSRVSCFLAWLEVPTFSLNISRKRFSIK